ncbi:MAG: twin-arginine translocase TatA/TatE family subunit [Propionibacteriaceae bacterium]|nr:twin-arginine translocase TatA/TatE family subunit [Propionibacteriaceae bacterium]
MTGLALWMPGIWQMVIVLVIVLLVFGGTRIAGIGKESGRAIREFKEELKGPESPSSQGETAGEASTAKLEAKATEQADS